MRLCTRGSGALSTEARSRVSSLTGRSLWRSREEVENSEVGRERGRRPELALTTTRRLARLERLLHKGIAATCLCPTHVARPRLEADCRALAQSVDTQLHPGALSFLLPRSAVCEGQ